MSKPTKFVYVSLSENLRFQHLVSQSDTIVPCNVYVDNNEHKIYLVEQPTGAIMDLTMSLYDTDTCINDGIGLHIGDILS